MVHGENADRLLPALVHAAASLNHMVAAMRRKGLELKRMTKVATLLSRSGFSSPGNYGDLAQDCVKSQYPDGGWVAVVDTMWNLAFLGGFESTEYLSVLARGEAYLEASKGPHGIWGRSIRDFERIPVSGTLLFLLPHLATRERLLSLEELWLKERNSLTYKAAYTLMAFSANGYSPSHAGLVQETLAWIVDNQREDGSFAPWKDHPVASDTYCTALALLGLLAYRDFVPAQSIARATKWLLDSQLSSGIWPFHEIEDGAGWALYALARVRATGGVVS